MRKLLVALALASIVAGIAATLAFASTKSVSLGDNFFSKRTLKIHKGTTVRWSWHTANVHNVTATKGARFHSKTGKRGSFSHKFTRKGTITIICTRHPTQMKMTIKVS